MPDSVPWLIVLLVLGFTIYKAGMATLACVRCGQSLVRKDCQPVHEDDTYQIMSIQSSGRHIQVKE